MARQTPLNLRPGADRRLLLVVASFGVSVVVTRAFLGATAYPKVGGGEFHVAHVLWGGVLLFAGGLIALTGASRRSGDAAAILIGSGVGLFIDEVGKFITTSNDYFFPVAAPIIYAVFMASVVILLVVRERFGDPLVPVPAAPARWPHLRSVLIVGYLGSGIVAIVESLGVVGLAASIRTPFDLLISPAAAAELSGNPLWLDVHAMVSAAAGALFIAATALLLGHRDGRGTRIRPGRLGHLADRARPGRVLRQPVRGRRRGRRPGVHGHRGDGAPGLAREHGRPGRGSALVLGLRHLAIGARQAAPDDAEGEDLAGVGRVGQLGRRRDRDDRDVVPLE